MTVVVVGFILNSGIGTVDEADGDGKPIQKLVKRERLSLADDLYSGALEVLVSQLVKQQ